MTKLNPECDLESIKVYAEDVRIGKESMNVASMLSVREHLNEMIEKRHEDTESFRVLDLCYDRICESVIGAVHTRRTGCKFE